MTLSELKTIIQNYVENDETTFVATLNDMIKIAEDRIFELIQLSKLSNLISHYKIFLRE